MENPREIEGSHVRLTLCRWCSNGGFGNTAGNTPGIGQGAYGNREYTKWFAVFVAEETARNGILDSGLGAIRDWRMDFVIRA